MTVNADGSANCDRCGAWLAGYGVIYGLVCTDLDPATANVREWIFCYINGCRAAVLSQVVNYPAAITASPPRCVDCDTQLAGRSVSVAMLGVDLAPVGGEPRMLAFCYLNDSRGRLLAAI